MRHNDATHSLARAKHCVVWQRSWLPSTVQAAQDTQPLTLIGRSDNGPSWANGQLGVLLEDLGRCSCQLYDALKACFMQLNCKPLIAGLDAAEEVFQF